MTARKILMLPISESPNRSQSKSATEPGIGPHLVPRLLSLLAIHFERFDEVVNSSKGSFCVARDKARWEMMVSGTLTLIYRWVPVSATVAPGVMDGPEVRQGWAAMW